MNSADCIAVDDQIEVLDQELQELADELEARAEDVVDLYEKKLEELLAERTQALAELQQEMQRRIHPVQQASIAFRKRHNAFTRAAQLPPELVGNILSVIQEEDPFSGRKWIALCHVCSHWRLIALAQRSLWASIQVTENTCPEWISMLIARSDRMPLNVFIKFWSLSLNTFLEAHAITLFPYVSRIGTLKIHAVPQFINELLLKLKHPAPALTSLQIRSTGSHSEEPISLPSTLFGRSAPQLEHLNLSASSYSLHRISLPLTITALVLDHQYCPDWDGDEDVDTLCRRLASLPHLEKALLHCVSSTYLPINSVKRAHTLPKLRELTLDSSLGDTCRILSHLQAPLITHLTIDAGSAIPDPEVDSFEELVVCTARFLNSASGGGTLKSLALAELSTIPHLRISAWDDPTRRPLLSLQVRSPVTTTALAKVPRILHLTHVQTLRLSSWDELVLFDAEVWRSWLEQMHGIKRLELALGQMMLFFDYLKGSAAHAPSLEVLVIEQLDFLGPATRPGDPMHGDDFWFWTPPKDGPHVQLVGEALTEVLMARKQMGLMIRSLHLVECSSCSPELEDALSATVGQLVVMQPTKSLRELALS